MKKIIIISITLMCALQFLSSCKKEEAKVSTYENAEKFIKEIDFQGSVLIQKGSKQILRESFGLADIPNKIPNEMETKFRIGSMSKAFTVFGIVKLKEQGLISSYDQKLEDFVSDFPYGDEITLRHLMRHSSGLPDHVGAFEELIIDQSLFFTPEDMFDAVVESIDEDGLQFNPGEAHQYSNANYLLLALLIEELSGQSYYDYIENAIAPLGMNETHLGENLITKSNEAKGYSNGVEVGEYPMQIAFGSGAWVSNILDLEIWANAWLNTLVSNTDKEEIFAQPKQDEITEFGMGWFVLQTQGKLVYFHGGDIDGFTSLLVLYPESNGMVIALSNKEDQRLKLDQMIEVFAKHEF